MASFYYQPAIIEKHVQLPDTSSVDSSVSCSTNDLKLLADVFPLAANTSTNHTHPKTMLRRSAYIRNLESFLSNPSP